MYSPKPFIGEATAENLSQYIQDELQAISRDQQETTALELREVHKEPIRPREGMVVSADGTDWDPGEGKGTYAYINGAWNFLGFVAPPDLTIFVEKANDGSDFDDIPTVRDNLGVAYGKQTIWIPAAAWVPRTTNGPSTGTLEMTTNKNMVKTLDFDASTQEFAQFDIRMPKSWDGGTITFIPVWSHAATVTNFGVVWGLDAIAVSDDDALDASWGTPQTSSDTGGTTNDCYQGPESSAITINGSPATGDLVMLRIHRDPANGSDTMAVDARLHGVVVLYNNVNTNDT